MDVHIGSTPKLQFKFYIKPPPPLPPSYKSVLTFDMDFKVTTATLCIYAEGCALTLQGTV